MSRKIFPLPPALDLPVARKAAGIAEDAGAAFAKVSSGGNDANRVLQQQLQTQLAVLKRALQTKLSKQQTSTDTNGELQEQGNSVDSGELRIATRPTSSPMPDSPALSPERGSKVNDKDAGRGENTQHANGRIALIHARQDKYQGLLEARKVIQWCDSASRMTLRKVNVSNSSILEATSMAVTGKIDDIFCAQLLYQIAKLLKGGDVKLYERWRAEYVQEHGERANRHEMAKEWRSVRFFA